MKYFSLAVLVVLCLGFSSEINQDYFSGYDVAFDAPNYRAKSIPSQTVAKSVVKKTAKVLTSEECLTNVVYNEAGSEPDEGKIAVAYTALTRNKGREKGLCKVVVKGGYAHAPPNLSKSASRKLWHRCKDIVLAVFKRDVPDPTNGATHFYSPKLRLALYKKEDPPKWNLDTYAEIGDHVFMGPLKAEETAN